MSAGERFALELDPGDAQLLRRMILHAMDSFEVVPGGTGDVARATKLLERVTYIVLSWSRSPEPGPLTPSQQLDAEDRAAERAEHECDDWRDGKCSRCGA